MKKTLQAPILILLAGAVFGQQRVELKNQANPRVTVNTTAPTACTVGDIFVDTDATSGRQVYVATATGPCVWTLQGDGNDGAGGGATAVTGLTDLKVARDSGTQLTVGGSCSTSAPCLVRIGNTQYSFADSQTITNPSGASGTVWFGVASDGTRTAWHNLTDITVSAGITKSSGATGFPAGSVPIASATVSTNAFEALGLSDARSMLSRERAAVAGTGISISNNANGQQTISAAPDDTAYNESTWNADTSAPTKNAVRDKIEALAPSGVVAEANIHSSIARDSEVSSTYAPLASPTFTGTVGLPAVTTTDNVRITFNPGANASGINVGCQSSAPDTPSNGDIYCDSDDGAVYVRVGGSWISIAAASGDVTAASSFGTDNRIVRSDGTGKGVQSTGITVDDSNNVSGAASMAVGTTPASSGVGRFPNNQSVCWRNAANSADICLKLNASDEFEIAAPINVTSTAAASLFTGVTSPSAPAGAEQWYFYADSADNLPKYIYNGESEVTFYTTANPPTTITGNAGTATALASNPTDCSANQFANAIAANGNLTCAALADADIPSAITRTIASGTKALDTDAISSTACDTLATTTATGVASTDVILITPNADITGVTGYSAATTGGLQIFAWPTTNTINWKVCNPTSSSVTPGAVTLNYRVVR